ncbi:MAG: hypothetical protein ACLUEK_00475 [Oscillospiraceae bacterium]
MIYLRFAGAAAALVWGLCTAFRPRVPLYYKIVFFGMASCFLGSCYGAGPAAGALGGGGSRRLFRLYRPLFLPVFVLLRGHKQPADGGGREFRRYRLIAGLRGAHRRVGPLRGLAGVGAARAADHLHPAVTMAAYFAAKLLIAGRGARHNRGDAAFNALVLVLCVVQAAEFCFAPAARRAGRCGLRRCAAGAGSARG